MYEVSIEEKPARKALTCEHRGAYMEIGKAFDYLGGWLEEHDKVTTETRLVALYYDDPTTVPEERLRSRAGILVSGDDHFESPFELTDICGGTYAVLHHRGPYSELPRAYQWLYGEWLANSGRQAADEPVLEEYLNTPRDTAPADLLTEICVPLR